MMNLPLMKMMNLKKSFQRMYLLEKERDVKKVAEKGARNQIFHAKKEEK